MLHKYDFGLVVWTLRLELAYLFI